MKRLKILILILATIVVFINIVPSTTYAKYVIECEIVATNVEIQSENTNSHNNSNTEDKNKKSKSSAKAQNKGNQQAQKKANAKSNTQKSQTKTNNKTVNNSTRIDQYKQKITQKGKVKTYIIRN